MAVALKLDRRAVGIDIRMDQLDIAKARLLDVIKEKEERDAK